jgi:hypothetical protein
MDKYIQKPVKYFIYYRIQDDYKSLDCTNKQESCLISFAERNEIPVEAIFYDTGSEYNQLEQLLLGIRNNEAQGILCLNESVITQSSSLLLLISNLVNLNKIRSILFTGQ